MSETNIVSKPVPPEVYDMLMMEFEELFGVKEIIYDVEEVKAETHHFNSSLHCFHVTVDGDHQIELGITKTETNMYISAAMTWVEDGDVEQGVTCAALSFSFTKELMQWAELNL